MISGAIKECIDTMDLNALNKIKSGSFTVEDLKILIPGPPGSDYHDEYFYIMYALYKENQKPDSEICSEQFEIFFNTLVDKFGNINFSETKTKDDELHVYNCLCFAINRKYNNEIIEFIVETYPVTLRWTKKEIMYSTANSRVKVINTPIDALYCAIKNNGEMSVVRIIVAELILLEQLNPPIIILHNYTKEILDYDVCKRVYAEDRSGIMGKNISILRYLANIGFTTKGLLNEFLSDFGTMGEDDFYTTFLDFIPVLKTLDLDTTEVDRGGFIPSHSLLIDFDSDYNEDKWKMPEGLFFELLDLVISRHNFKNQKHRSWFFISLLGANTFYFLCPSNLLYCLKRIASFNIENVFSLPIKNYESPNGNSDIDEEDLCLFELFTGYVEGYDFYCEQYEIPVEQKKKENKSLRSVLYFLLEHGAGPPDGYDYGEFPSSTIERWIKDGVIEGKSRQNALIMARVFDLPGKAKPGSKLKLLNKNNLRTLFDDFLE